MKFETALLFGKAVFVTKTTIAKEGSYEIIRSRNYS